MNIMVDNSKKIIDYIKSHETEIINNELTAAKIAEKFGVTNQLIYHHAMKVNEGLFKRKKSKTTEGLRIIANDIKEGIPLEFIFEQPYARPFLTKRGSESIHRAKDLLINKLILREIVSPDDEINRYILVNAKLEIYISTLQIEKTLKENPNVNKAQLARNLNVSHRKVLGVNTDIKKEPYRVLPKMPQRLYDILKRNIDITMEYFELGSKKAVYEKHSDIDKRTLRLIIDSYEPYVKKRPLGNDDK